MDPPSRPASGGAARHTRARAAAAGRAVPIPDCLPTPQTIVRRLCRADGRTGDAAWRGFYPELRYNEAGPTCAATVDASATRRSTAIGASRSRSPNPTRRGSRTSRRRRVASSTDERHTTNWRDRHPRNVVDVAHRTPDERCGTPANPRIAVGGRRPASPICGSAFRHFRAARSGVRSSTESTPVHPDYSMPSRRSRAYLPRPTARTMSQSTAIKPRPKADAAMATHTSSLKP